MCDLGCKIVKVNPVATETLGYAEKDLIDRDI
jgi:hypothetical protein